ncbi:MAG: glycosyltransferase [Prosthecobacter sp.]|nr:glycosyltransferase [Prosthecobacter sp.]
MHLALLPLGSAGDVFPFLWLARQLRARGHRVTMIVASIFEETVRSTGLEVLPYGSQEDFERFIADPRVWRMYEGTKLVFEYAGENTEIFTQAIESLRPDLLLAPCTAFGARLAREVLRIPLITVHVQPAVMISAHELPVLFPGMQHLRRLPLWLKRILIRLPNPADRFAAPGVAKACEARGITPPRKLWWDWGNSPDGVLCLFPEWFARPQADWPSNLLQWAFPLEDMAVEKPLGDGVLRFLAAGDKPIIFTPGSANIQAERFFAVALEAVTRLGKRAIFVTRKLQQLPPDLPATVLPVEYAPFSTLLPHAAAFVHHGGIGRLSQGFAGGVPQLLMAMAHDQPDNAHRLEQLGAGLGLTPRTFTPDRVAAALTRLLTDPAIAQATRRCAGHLEERRDPGALLDWIETRRLMP